MAIKEFKEGHYYTHCITPRIAEEVGDWYFKGDMDFIFEYKVLRAKKVYDESRYNRVLFDKDPNQYKNEVYSSGGWCFFGFMEYFTEISLEKLFEELEK